MILQVWEADCSDDAEFVDITPDLQQKFLDSHNKLRNQQALGQTPGYEPAIHMATMVIIQFYSHFVIFIEIIFNLKYNRHGTMNWLKLQNIIQNNAKWSMINAEAHGHTNTLAKIWHFMETMIMHSSLIGRHHSGLKNTLVLT